MATLDVKNLVVSVDGTLILKGIDLTINTGEVHALIGPNGHGKSTLLNTVMGHYNYKVEDGHIYLDGKDIVNDTVDQRAKDGIFLAMQYPPEIPGVNNSDFLKAAINSRRERPISLFEFIKGLEKGSKEVGLSLDMAHRNLNEGFSGGEKKRNELLQMKLLKPKFALLDEIDSGLDVDALKVVASTINELKGNEFGTVIISHYSKLYELIQPTHVHIIVDGKIALSGGKELLDKVNTVGYEFLTKEYGIKITKEKKQPVSLGSCAVKEVTSK